MTHTDPYVKVSLMCEGRRLKKRKTSTKRNTLNPVYNEAIVFDVPPENIDQINLSIAVMDYDRWDACSCQILPDKTLRARFVPRNKVGLFCFFFSYKQEINVVLSWVEVSIFLLLLFVSFCQAEFPYWILKYKLASTADVSKLHVCSAELR